jgi:CheY-like chemotaxis protein
MVVLIVEDDPAQAASLAKALSPAGKVMVTATLDAALLALGSETPDIIVLDATFPRCGEGGPFAVPEFLAPHIVKYFEEHRLSSRILLISGNPDAGQHIDCMINWLRSGTVFGLVPKNLGDQLGFV